MPAQEKDISLFECSLFSIIVDVILLTNGLA